MKAKKSGFIVCLAIALLFAVAGAVLMFLPQPYSPVVVGDNVTASYSAGHIYFGGTLKNDSDDSVVITYLEIEVKVSGGTETGYDNDNITLAPGEEYDLDGLYLISWERPDHISKICVVADGVEYIAYSATGKYFTWTVLAFMFAVILGIVGICSVIGYFNQNKRYRKAEEELASCVGNPVLALGYYGSKGDKGKAAAKTAVSVVGGVFSALLFGFGAYKIYGANNAKEFVITDEGLYIGNAGRKKFDLSNMQFIPAYEMPDSELTVNKNIVTMTNVFTQEYFVFDLSSNKCVTAEEFKVRLENLLSAKKTAPAQEFTVQMDKPDDDPFGV